MTSSEAGTVQTAGPVQSAVPAPRPAPRQEERPRRRHDGYYWDITTADWHRCPGRG